jgi:general secretion pathway protein B
MSILLDALKKSEEQRQLGKTPDIHGSADHDPAGERKSGGMWLPLSMMAVTAVAITWFGWQQYREPEPAIVSGSRDVSPVSVPATKPAVQQPAPDSRTPVESFTAAGEEAVEPPEESTVDEAMRGREELARSISQYREPAQEQSESPDAGTPGAAVPDTGPAIPVSQPGSSTPAPVQPHISDPVSYWELPQNVRDSLPEFNISVMVYAEEAENRFLLINGQRMVEKDSMEGVELVEIRRNGAVFRYRNYRFLVKG